MTKLLLVFLPPRSDIYLPNGTRARLDRVIAGFESIGDWKRKAIDDSRELWMFRSDVNPTEEELATTRDGDTQFVAALLHASSMRSELEEFDRTLRRVFPQVISVAELVSRSSRGAYLRFCRLVDGLAGFEQKDIASHFDKLMEILFARPDTERLVDTLHSLLKPLQNMSGYLDLWRSSRSSSDEQALLDLYANGEARRVIQRGRSLLYGTSATQLSIKVIIERMVLVLNRDSRLQLLSHWAEVQRLFPDEPWTRHGSSTSELARELAEWQAANRIVEGLANGCLIDEVLPALQTQNAFKAWQWELAEASTRLVSSCETVSSENKAFLPARY